MNILYIGFAVDRKFEKQYNGISVAGNKMQVNFLKELSRISDGDNLHIISIMPIAAYPRDKRIIVKKGIVDIEPSMGVSGIVPFMFNLPFIKNLYEIVETYNEARKIAAKQKIDKVVIFNAFPQTAYAALRLQKKYGCEVTCLLADLPIDDSIKTRGLRYILRNIFDRYTRKAIKRMNKLVVLNKRAAMDFAPSVPYVVMEGAVSQEDIRPFSWRAPVERNVVFTGALQKHNGIVELVESIVRLSDTKIVCDIYGDGEYREYVKKMASEHSNIRYHGKISNAEVQKKQREAFLLINPRPVENYISQVTFPSKIFEYMLSGTPVLTTRLNGFTEEYFDTMFFIEDNSSELIEKKIREILNLSEVELENLARKAYTLVCEKKNWKKQTKRMYEFIETSK